MGTGHYLRCPCPFKNSCGAVKVLMIFNEVIAELFHLTFEERHSDSSGIADG
jgi:hypothetical protein